MGMQDLFVVIMSGFFIHAFWLIKEDRAFRKALLEHLVKTRLNIKKS